MVCQVVDVRIYRCAESEFKVLNALDFWIANNELNGSHRMNVRTHAGGMMRDSLMVKGLKKGYLAQIM